MRGHQAFLGFSPTSGTEPSAPSASRTDRVAKYNQLLRIEERLGEDAVFPGFKALSAHPVLRPPRVVGPAEGARREGE